MTPRPFHMLVLALALPFAACQSPKVQSAGRRLGTDAWVTLTSPVQLPAMSFRDAAEWEADPEIRILLFPLIFPIYFVEHTVFTVVHAVDLVLAPVHLFNEWEPLYIYQTDTFPMRVYPDAIESFETGFATLFVLLGGTALSLLLSG